MLRLYLQRFDATFLELGDSLFQELDLPRPSAQIKITLEVYSNQSLDF